MLTTEKTADYVKRWVAAFEAKDLDRRYFCGITDEMLAADRRALCGVDEAALKAMAADLGKAAEHGTRVAFGSKEAVEAAKELFDRVETL